MAEIVLSQGKVALVDDEDYEFLSQWNWHVLFNGHNYYAKCNKYLGTIEGKRKFKCLLMHRVIAERIGMDLTSFIDHKDRDGLNNQRNNLRSANPHENNQNQKIRKDNKSGVKGVCWLKREKMWKAYIHLERKQKTLGYFKEKTDAVKARLDAEKLYYPYSEVCP